MKEKLLKGKTFEFKDHGDNMISVWFQSKTSNFCISLNGSVIKAVKSFNAMKSRLDEFFILTEIYH